MRMKMILCMSLLAVSCLCGCSQNEKVSLSETYDSENISAINMQIDSWQLKIMASADDDVHVTLDGGAAKGAKAPSAEIQDSVLNIVQAESEDAVLSQFSLGKEGEVTVYVLIRWKEQLPLKMAPAIWKSTALLLPNSRLIILPAILK